MNQLPPGKYTCEVPIVPSNLRSTAAVLAVYFFGYLFGRTTNELPFWVALVIGFIAGRWVFFITHYVGLQYVHTLVEKGVMPKIRPQS